MRELVRRSYEASELMRATPPRLVDRNKRLVFELCNGGAASGSVEVTRWAAAALPAQLPAATPEVTCVAGVFEYTGAPGEWHVNFADAHLFGFYAGGLFAQDEMQCAEHPTLCAVREALIAEGVPALTEEAEPTPVLVKSVPRACVIETRGGLYGHGFQAASHEAITRAVTRLEPAPRSNIIAIAAPPGGRGRYRRDEIERILVTAYTGFAAAVHETEGPTTICTGFWGCGAFGGDKQLMTLLQLLAARLAGASVVRFYAFDPAGRAAFDAAVATLAEIGSGTVAEVLARVESAGYVWGQSNGT